MMMMMMMIKYISCRDLKTSNTVKTNQCITLCDFSIQMVQAWQTKTIY